MTFKVSDPTLQLVSADNTTLNLNIGVESRVTVLFNYAGNNGCVVNLPSASEAGYGYIVDLWHRGEGGNVVVNRSGVDTIFTFDRQSVAQETFATGNRKKFISNGTNQWYSATN